MNQKIIKEIKNLSILLFEDEEYLIFNKYINNKKFNSARLYIDTFLTKLENNSENENFFSEQKLANRIEDLIMSLC